MKNIVLFGPPGCGKGTQTAKLVEKYNMISISSGELFRKHMKLGDELGKLAATYIDEGNLVPDSVVIDMMKHTLEELNAPNGVILDGFPRTTAQAEALDVIMEEMGQTISCMVSIHVPVDELKNRITSRGKTSGRSDDANMEKINTRLDVYFRDTQKVIDFYEPQGKYHHVEGMAEIDIVFNRICTIIEACK